MESETGSVNLLATPARRRVLFACLYVSEGAPIGFLWEALPTRLAIAGVPDRRIGELASLLVLPWVFKFAWAPLVDVLRTPAEARRQRARRSSICCMRTRSRGCGWCAVSSRTP